MEPECEARKLLLILMFRRNPRRTAVDIEAHADAVVRATSDLDNGVWRARHTHRLARGRGPLIQLRSIL